VVGGKGQSHGGGLAQDRGLISLSLESSDMGAAGLAALTRALAGHPTLRVLDLGRSNGLGSEAGVVAIADLIRKTSLTTLRLEDYDDKLTETQLRDLSNTPFALAAKTVFVTEV
jgi:hypothetical protein